MLRRAITVAQCPPSPLSLSLALPHSQGQRLFSTSEHDPEAHTRAARSIAPTRPWRRPHASRRQAESARRSSPRHLRGPQHSAVPGPHATHRHAAAAASHCHTGAVQSVINRGCPCAYDKPCQYSRAVLSRSLPLAGYHLLKINH